MRLPFVSVIVVAVAAVLTIPTLADKKQAEAEAKNISVMKEFLTFESEVIETPMDLAVTYTETAEAKDEYQSKYDFDSLRKENEDIIAWIDVPNSNIDYPVLFDGTDRYLHMNLGKEDSTAGSIYVDATAEKALNESINILYGHHMKNGTMFADVDEFSNQEFWNDHQEVNIYMEDKELNLRPVVCVVGKSDIALREIESIDDLKSFCKDKTITQGDIPDEWEDLYVLVTCNYTGDNYRTYLFCTK